MNDKINIIRFFRFKRIIIPVVISIGVALWLILRDMQTDILSTIQWNLNSVLWLCIALLMVIIRDVGYIIRIRLLTDYSLNWKKSFQIIMLWEFASTITPSVVGGSAIAMFLIHKEKIPLGRSTAVVMITALLDELFYIIAVPVVFFSIAGLSMFGAPDFSFLGKQSSQYMFLAGYFFILILILAITYAIFINPRGFKWLLIRIFKFRFIRRWRYGAMLTGNDIMITSHEMKGRSIFFWFKTFGATVLSWTARFAMVNFLIMAFMPVDNHLHIFATQLFMWVILLVSPTPGGAGLAEYVFSDFLSPFLIVGFAPILAFLWRMLTYFLYILVGSIVLPLWLNRVIKIRTH